MVKNVKCHRTNKKDCFRRQDSIIRCFSPSVFEVFRTLSSHESNLSFITWRNDIFRKSWCFFVGPLLIPLFCLGLLPLVDLWYPFFRTRNYRAPANLIRLDLYQSSSKTINRILLKNLHCYANLYSSRSGHIRKDTRLVYNALSTCGISFKHFPMDQYVNRHTQKRLLSNETSHISSYHGNPFSIPYKHAQLRVVQINRQLTPISNAHRHWKLNSLRQVKERTKLFFCACFFSSTFTWVAFVTCY